MQEYVLPDTPTPWWVKRKWPLPGRGTSRCSTGFWEAANSAAVTPMRVLNMDMKNGPAQRPSASRVTVKSRASASRGSLDGTGERL